MKESTKKAIDWATGVVSEAGMEITPAGFKYHSERLWIALTPGNDLILLTIPADGKTAPDLKIARAEYLEAFTAAYKGEKKPKTKKERKSDAG